MKKLFLLFILLLWQTGYTQFLKNDGLYFGFDITKGFAFNVNYVYKNQYSIQGGFLQFFFDSPDTPSDYYSKGCFGGEPSHYVRENMNIAYLLIGKVYLLDKKHNIRANLMGGISYNRAFIPVNFRKNEPPGWFTLCDKNYKYDIIKKDYAGLMLMPQIEIPIWRYVGIRLGTIVNFNKRKNLFGFNLGLIFGKLR